MDGVLLRKSRKLNREKWVSAYYTIRDGNLLRFNSSTSSKVRETLNLSDCFLRCKVSDVRFELLPNNHAAIVLQAENKRLRKKWERALSTFTAQEKSAIDLSDTEEAAVVTSSDGIIRAASSAMVELSGHTSSAMVGRNVSMLVPARIAKAHDGLIARYLAGGSNKLVGKPRRVTMRTSTGEEIPVILILSEVSHGGARHFMAVLHRDEPSSVRFNLDHISSPAVTADDSGVIRSVNDRVTALFGYTREEMIDANVTLLMPDSMERAHHAYMQRYQSGRGGKLIGQPRRVIAQRKDGSLFEALLTLGELFDNGQKMLLGVFSNVAEADAKANLVFDGAGNSSDDESLTDEAPTDRSSLSIISRSSSVPSRFTNSEMSEVATLDLPAEYRRVLHSLQAGMEGLLARELTRLHERSSNASGSGTPRGGSRGAAKTSTMPTGVEQGSVIIERRISQGGGSGCAVFSVTVQGWRCAMKELDISRTNQKTVECFLKEISVCEGLPYHPNICRYLFHDRAGDRLRLFMTQYEGTLYDRLLKMKDAGRSFSVRETVGLAQDLLQGIAFLHKHQLLHRDLKSENVFVILNDRDEVHSLAVGDFDQAKTGNATTVVGTPGYTAPEVLSGTPYSYPSDVWSFGMIVYEMTALQRPFEGLSMLQLSKAIAAGPPPFPDGGSEGLEAIYRACTVIDPSRRATVEQLQQMLATIPF